MGKGESESSALVCDATPSFRRKRGESNIKSYLFEVLGADPKPYGKVLDVFISDRAIDIGDSRIWMDHFELSDAIAIRGFQVQDANNDFEVVDPADASARSAVKDTVKAITDYCNATGKKLHLSVQESQSPVWADLGGSADRGEVSESLAEDYWTVAYAPSDSRSQ